MTGTAAADGPPQLPVHMESSHDARVYGRIPYEQVER